MEITDHQNTLRTCIALFGSVIFHCLIILVLFINFPDTEKKSKTIPFQLVHNDRHGASANTSAMNRTENTLAAQEFLRTLNESSFEQLIRKNTGRDVEIKENTSPFRSDFQPEAPTLFTLPSSTHSNPSSAFEGLQNIFSKTHNKNRPQNEVQQISSQSLDQLSDYEIQLLQKLAKKELYDAFHQVMQRYNQEKVDYTVTLYLFPNGAIKNATLKESSNIKEIDQLAIQAAFQASPFPKPPAKDIANNYQYDIPIIYIKQPE